MRHVRPGESGFTLLEVLVATFVLSVLIVSTAALLLVAITQGAVSKRAADAATLAQRELEVVRDMAFGAIPVGTAVMARTVGAHTYTMQRVVTDNDPQPNMKRIRVTMTWQIRGARSYDAETIFTDLEQ